jgi:hypothetical protein
MEIPNKRLDNHHPSPSPHPSQPWGVDAYLLVNGVIVSFLDYKYCLPTGVFPFWGTIRLDQCLGIEGTECPRREAMREEMQKETLAGETS